ncbi:MAG: CapA family protein [Acidobacteriota bacterium]
MQPRLTGSALSIVFAGDVSFGREIGAAMDREGRHAPFRKIAGALAGADFRVANLECVITEQIRGRPGKAVVLRAHPDAAVALREGGFGLVSLANNHILDFGAEGMRDTVRALEGSGIDCVGAGENLAEATKPEILRGAGTSVAILAATGTFGATRRKPGFAPLRLATLRTAIRNARAEVEHIVVLVHWGLEMEGQIAQVHRHLGHRLIAMGASLVVGHGPHVLQPVEKAGRGWIAYSLGNLLFDQSEPEARHGALLQAVFTPQGISEMQLLPIVLDDRGFPEWPGKRVSLDLEATGVLWKPDGYERQRAGRVDDRFLADVFTAKRRHGWVSFLWLVLKRGWRMPFSYYRGLVGFLIRKLKNGWSRARAGRGRGDEDL